MDVEWIGWRHNGQAETEWTAGDRMNRLR